MINLINLQNQNQEAQAAVAAASQAAKVMNKRAALSKNKKIKKRVAR